MTYDELFDLFLSADVSHDLWKKVLEEMQRRDEAAADAISGNTVTLANPALTGAGALSTTMKVAGKGLMVYGVYSGLDRAANTTDEGEKARGYLDATWSAVPGPIGIAGAFGNAAGQQIEKIDTGTATADGGSTVRDWLTAVSQEYFENGFVDTFISGWSIIFN